MPVNKRYADFAAAVADVPDGATILFGGFAGPGGFPSHLTWALYKQGARNLTVVCNIMGDVTLTMEFLDLRVLFLNRQVRKAIASYPVAPTPTHQSPFELLYNAGGQFVRYMPGMCFFHHADSFAMIRGGHIDITALGALQVSEKGDLANWFLPQRGVGNVGGAMDLAAGAKLVIVAMEHTTKEGSPKILKRCTYPLTGKECVDLIVTDLAVVQVTRDGLLLKEIAPGWTAAEIQALTEPRLLIATDLKEIEL